MSGGSRQLQPSIVLVADVLGYKSIIAEAAKDYGRLESALNDFTEAYQSAIADLRQISMTEWTVRLFSDNLFLQADLPFRAGDRVDGESQSGRLFESVSQFQRTLLQHGYLVRGAMAGGLSFIGDELIFGPPVVEAHEIETQIAKYPRIVLSDGMMRLVAKHLSYYGFQNAPQQTFLLEDALGRWFVSYLDDIVFDVDEAGRQFDEDFVKLHRRVILDGFATATRTSVREKYLWLASYHDFFCHSIDEPTLVTGIESPIPQPHRLSAETIQTHYADYKRRLGSLPDVPNVALIVASVKEGTAQAYFEHETRAGQERLARFGLKVASSEDPEVIRPGG